MKKFLYILLAVLIVILVGLGIGAYYLYDNVIEIDGIYKGVSIDGYSMADKSKEEALELLKSEKEIDKEKTMVIADGDSSYTMTLEEIGFSYDYEKAVEEAYSIGRDGNLIDRFKKIRDLEINKENIELESSYDKEKIVEVANTIANNLEVEPQNATFNFNGGNFLIGEEVDGKKVDRNKLAELIENNVYILDDIEVPTEVVKAEKTREMYSRINGVIGDFVTAYPNSTPGRKANIAISTEALNGKIVFPGETFSYNNATGPRSRANGYGEASVIINGEYTPGVGGGVCQTSTTFYNSLLQADLTIIQRTPHSLPPGYVPNGTDAAVNDGSMDLVFRNDFDFPIYIAAWTTNDRVYVSIYGDVNSKDYTVKVEPVLVETIPFETVEQVDNNMAPGTRELVTTGRNGYKYQTFKYKIRNGQVIEKEHVSSDYYRGRNQVYKVGPTQ